MKICMLLEKAVQHDGRVQREARALAAAGHEVVVIHLPTARSSSLADQPFSLTAATLPRWRRLPFRLRRLAEALNIARLARRARADVIHAHDVSMLGPGYVAAQLSRVPLVYDSHELAVGVPYRSRAGAVLTRVIERLVVPRCGLVITVSEAIARRLAERYRLASRPVVVHNACELPPPGSSPARDLRAELGADGGPLILHQGAVGPDRGCENLIRAIGELTTAHLLFLGAQGSYSARLRALADELGVGQRVHLHPPVPLGELLSHTAQADVGVSLLEDTCENHRLALPNKLFEYISAAVPVVVSDLPEMAALVRGYGIGEVADPRNPPSIAKAISRLLASASDEGLERNLARAAAELAWEKAARSLQLAYDALPQPRRSSEDDAPSAVVLVRGTATHDSRVLRSARTLQRIGHQAVVLGATSPAERATTTMVDGVQIIRVRARSPFELALGWLTRLRGRGAGAGSIDEANVPGMLAEGGLRPSSPHISVLVRMHRYLRALDFYRRAFGRLRRWRPRLVHCNDYDTMWVGVAARLLLGSAVVYDSHELWPDRNGRPEARWWLLLCEALFVRCANRITVTSPGHAEVLARRYGIREPTVVRNVPDIEPLRSPPGTADQRSGDGSESNRSGTLVYAGGIMTSRGLEQLIAALELSGSPRLEIIGFGRADYVEGLRRRIDAAGLAERVDLRPPVHPRQLPAALAHATAGVALFQPTCLSYEQGLPNKLFEYLTAGLPVLVSDLPVLGGFVRRFGIGLIASPDDPVEIAKAIERIIDPAVNASLRERVNETRELISWDREREVLERVYRAAENGFTRS